MQSSYNELHCSQAIGRRQLCLHPNRSSFSSQSQRTTPILRVVHTRICFLYPVMAKAQFSLREASSKPNSSRNCNSISRRLLVSSCVIWTIRSDIPGPMPLANFWAVISFSQVQSGPSVDKNKYVGERVKSRTKLIPICSTSHA